MAGAATASTPSRPLRCGVRIFALLVLLGTSGFWAAKGAHRGWSQNKVPISQKDEITGLDYVTYEDRFVPGIEFLGAGVGLAFGLFAASFLIQRKST